MNRRKKILKAFRTENLKNPITLASIAEALEIADAKMARKRELTAGEKSQIHAECKL